MPQTGVRPEGRLVDWKEFISEDDDDTYDWVIPNVLERQERLMVVASEGVGKTFLARQVALLTAAGIHPFTFEQMKPIRTLMVDLENPARIIRRTSRAIQERSTKYGFCAEPVAHLLIKPDGLDLMKTSDRAYLEEQIEIVKPDMLFLGPIYKSFIDPGGRTSESIAIEIAKYFDSLRTYYDFGMWLEHHAPLGSSMSSRDLRPFGSAVWSRWPEFGLSLQPDPTATEGYVYEVKHFRGARDKRQFPTKMTRGTLFPFEVLEFARMD
jgi:replicative DNA helicase